VVRKSAGSPEQVAALLAHIGYRPDDIYLTTGPLYHSGPGGFMNIAMAMGQTVVVQRKFDAEDWLRLLETYRATSTFSAPTPIRMITNLPAEVKQRYVEDFPPESLLEVFGSTELSVNTVLRTAATGPEATGELFVRSPSVFSDYYKQHDKFEEDHRDGYQTVGDIAYFDDEGFIYICDRKKDMIISGGMNIYPAEIEAVLEAHPKVVEAAVFGIPSEDWGEIVHAEVVPVAGSDLTEAELSSHARAQLAGYKLPRSFGWRDELPKTGSGKVLKRELRQPYWQEHDTNL
jgi:acyl-CoA synthetase (AMP-forming)/AMP-acid ligase II